MKATIIANVLMLITCVNASADTKWASVVPRQTKQVVIAIIDTGISPELLKGNSYCKDGHKDFTGTGLKDNYGHGTHISSIVDQYAKNYIFSENNNYKKIDNIYENYCQIIIKFFDPKAIGNDNLSTTIKSFKWAIDHNVDIINYSGGGTIFSKEEKAIVKEALDKGIIVVAAAGNEGQDLDKHNYYPAMYDKRIYIVGNIVDESRKIAKTSNYGKSVNTWEVGTKVLSRLPANTYGTMTGTSQSTAVKSGKLIRKILLKP